jgi:urea transport system permease protein
MASSSCSGAYGAWALHSTLGLGLIASLPIIFFGVACLGWLVEKGVIRHLYQRPLDTILATWGIGVMLQQIVRLTAGGTALCGDARPDFAFVVILGVHVPATGSSFSCLSGSCSASPGT